MKRHLRLLLPVLVVVLTLQLGPSCGVPVPPLAGVRAEAIRAIRVGESYAVKIKIVVTADLPFQAYDIDLRWNPDVVQVVADTLTPHGEFDDDGALFAPVDLNEQEGWLRGIVDLRHGGPGISGEVIVATVWFYAAEGGQAVVRAEGDIVGGDGAPFVVSSAPAMRYPASH